MRRLRRLVPALLAVLLVVAVGISWWRITDTGKIPELTFKTKQTQCWQSPSATIIFRRDTFHFSGTLMVSLSSDANDLEATLEINESSDDSAYQELIIKLRPVNNPEKDTGTDRDLWRPRHLSFRGELGPIDYGSYDIKLQHGTWTLAEQKIVYSAPKLLFQSLNGSCGINNDSVTNMSLWNGNLTFSGSVVTSNPCHTLTADAEIVTLPNADNVSEVIINISAVSNLGEDEACIECIGSVPFSGEFGPLEPGRYNVSIIYQGEIIEQLEIERHYPKLAGKGKEKGWYECCPDKLHSIVSWEDVPKADICTCDGRSFIAINFGEEPNTCHSLDARIVYLPSYESPHTVIVKPVRTDCAGICGQAFVHLFVIGEITDLDPGEYDIQILYGNNVMAQQDVVIE